MRIDLSGTEDIPVGFERRSSSRELELAIAFVRSSSPIARLQPPLRKCAALFHREDGGSVIIQRIIGSDPKVLAALQSIFSGMCLDTESRNPGSMMELLKFYSWEIVREAIFAVLMHEVHKEVALVAGRSALELDRRAIAILEGSVLLGDKSCAGLFVNVGEMAIMIQNDARAKTIQHNRYLSLDARIAEERANYGFDHGILGAALLKEVDFPEEICASVYEHCRNSKFAVAEHLVEMRSNAETGATGSFRPASLQDLRLSEASCEKMMISMAGAANLCDLVFSGIDSKAAA